MIRTMIAQARADEPVRIEGFLEHVRNTRYMAFLVVRDRSGSVQATIEKQLHPEWTELLETLTVESVVSIEGTLRENSQVKLGGQELIPTKLEILSLAAALPLTKDANIDTRMDYRWLDLRGREGAVALRGANLPRLRDARFPAATRVSRNSHTEADRSRERKRRRCVRGRVL